MTGIKQFFSGCITLALLFFIGVANADDADSVARAATRRGATTTVSRTQTANSAGTQSIGTSGISRSTNTYDPQTSSGTSVRNRATTNTTSRTNNVVVRDTGARTTTETATNGVSARTATNVLPRGTTNTSTVISTPSRAAISRGTVGTTSRTGTITRTPSTQSSGARGGTATVSRAATVSRNAIQTAANTGTARRTTSSGARLSRAGTMTAEEIMNRDYTTCRDVYYSCMDEFCANKDSQLKRCACSSRINEFDDVKAQLAQVEDKLLDFNQRLLTVNMDKEDAEAIFKPTEGEIAFQQDDNSDSKKLLDEISEKLNDTFDTSSFDANLAPISLSLNVDAAFDNVDSLAGASTTAKSGTELYASALPICREMALEVCTQDELDIVESGYQMAIEQDCNTVAKAYQTQQDLAREKIREGSALLDISRLDTYQQRNSDDILTCKKKMLDMLTNTSVCGENLEQCLDISGQYIDPSTGEAILTSELVNLGNLITRPGPNQTWTGAPGNAKFVSYLTSKKMFLESATENCQDIADYVWDSFIEDALAQIKLAQEKKLEEVRQSCTTLTTQCLTDAYDSLEEFDARSLSVFGVEADKTVKQMCSEVQNACTALLDTVDGGTDWSSGMTEIASDKTYETIMQTCREVGRNCIIQSCKSISGNFGLCENIQTSVNRKAIINRTACWDEVLNCVADAGITSINKITELQQADGLIDTNGSFYSSIYGQYTNDDITNDELSSNFTSTSCILDESDTTNCIFDICADDCGFTFDGTTISYNNASSDECQVCRLAEKIWGNCEVHPATNLSAENSHNQIKIPTVASDETLLSWFAKNTGTDTALDSCRDTSCGPGYIATWDAAAQATVCVSQSGISGDGDLCPTDKFWRVNVGNTTNCCKTSDNANGGRDTFGNCCLGGLQNRIENLDWGKTTAYWGNVRIPSTIGSAGGSVEGTAPTADGGLCLPANATFIMSFPVSGDYYGNNGLGYVFCIGEKSDVSEPDENAAYPSGKKIHCNGEYVIVTKNGQYMAPLYNVPDNIPDPQPQNPICSYNESVEVGDNVSCVRTFGGDAWSWLNGQTQCQNQSPTNFKITYQ